MRFGKIFTIDMINHKKRKSSEKIELLSEEDSKL